MYPDDPKYMAYSARPVTEDQPQATAAQPEGGAAGGQGPAASSPGGVVGDSVRPKPTPSSTSKQRRMADRENKRNAEKVVPDTRPKIKPAAKQLKKMSKEQLAAFDALHNPQPKPVLVAPENVTKLKTVVTQGGQAFAYEQVKPKRSGKPSDWEPNAAKYKARKQQQNGPTDAQVRAWHLKWDNKPRSAERPVKQPKAKEPKLKRPQKCPACNASCITIDGPTGTLWGNIYCYRCYTDTPWGKPVRPATPTGPLTEEGRREPERVVSQEPQQQPQPQRGATAAKPNTYAQKCAGNKASSEPGGSAKAPSARALRRRANRPSGAVSNPEMGSSCTGSVTPSMTRTQRRNRQRRRANEARRAAFQLAALPEVEQEAPPRPDHLGDQHVDLMAAADQIIEARIEARQQAEAVLWELMVPIRELRANPELFAAEDPDCIAAQAAIDAAHRDVQEAAAARGELLREPVEEAEPLQQEPDKPRHGFNLAPDHTMTSDGKPAEGFMYTHRVGRVPTTGVRAFGKTWKGPFGMAKREVLRKENEILDSELYYYLQSQMFGLNSTAAQLVPLQKKAQAWMQKNRPNLSEEEKFYRMATAVTEAMLPHPQIEKLRQRLKDDTANEAIQKKAAMLRGDLGTSGLLGTRKVLPSVVKEAA